ncbi:MAG: hypothetical protein ACAI38_24005 [Myxococcota bacterium]
MTAGRITGPRIAIGAVLTALTTVIVWSCAGELDDVERYRLGASTLRSCFGDDEPPRFLTSSRCKQCHLSKDNGIGAALDLSSGNIGGRFSQLIGACPEELLVDPANPEASTLYRYLNDEIDGCTYHKMPPTGAGLSSADKRCLLTWIDGLDDVDDLQLDDGAPVDDGEGAGGDGDGGDTMPGDGDGDMMPGDMDMDPPAPTLTEIREQIFDVHCAGCHDTGSPSAGLELGPDVPIADLYDNLVNVPVITNPTTLDYVEPNNIGASFLVRKLRGTMDTAPGCAVGTCGLRMPRNLPALSDPLIEMVEDWINAGALEN